MSGLVIINSLVCLVMAGSPAETSPQKLAQATTPNGLLTQSDATRCAVYTLVEPCKTPLLIELGRSRLLSFSNGIRRTALSNTGVGDVVQVGSKDVLILGRNEGVTNFTVWHDSPRVAPTVIVVRVERRPSQDP